MADLDLSCQAMRDRILVFQNLAVATATDAQKVTAILRLNDGYRRFIRGDYRDEEGRRQLHNWNFLEPWATLDILDGTTEYALPAGFGGQNEKFTIAYTAGEKFQNYQRVSPGFIADYHRDTDTENEPIYYAIMPVAFVVATGQRYEVRFAPQPDTDRTLRYRYRLLVAPLTDDAAKYAQGGAEFCDVIIAAAKAEDERLNGNVSGPEEGHYNNLMQGAVLRDEASYSSEADVEQLTDVHVGATP